MKSLRLRLTVGVAASTGLLLLLFGAVLYGMTRRALEAESDAFLLSAAQAMAGSVDAGEGELEIALDPDKVAQLEGAGPPLYFQFWLADGTPLVRSRGDGQVDLPRFSGPGGTSAYRDLTFDNGETARALGLRFTPVPEPVYILTANGLELAPPPEKLEPLIMVAARSTEPLRARLAAFRALLFGAGGLTMLAAAGLVLFVVRHGLRPLDDLAGRIAAIKEGNLAVRLPAERMPRELQLIVGKLNDLLGRLDAAMDRERSFTADVAHELRTPLAGMLTTVEVALTIPRADADYAEALRDVLAIAERTRAMVERLLVLARLDAGQIALGDETTTLAELLAACWDAVAARAEARGLRFDNDVPPGAACAGAPENLAMVLANLLENAVEYADEGGRIWARARLDDDAVELTVANTGCTLTPAEAGQVFERFWRADAARTDTGQHCGLGLALVRRMVTALGGRAEAHVRDGGVFEVGLTLPRRHSPS